MPCPKDLQKLQEYKEKQSRIALERGYGKWMKGKKTPRDVVEKQKITFQNNLTVERREKLSVLAIQRGYGKWMKGKIANLGFLESAKSRLGKTYEEIYGKEKGQKEADKRKQSNQMHWEGHIRNGCRDKHNPESLYKTWRKQVFERDDYICQECKVVGSKLHAHHIKEWATFPDLRYVLDNGQTLCVKCHSEKHENVGLFKSHK